MTLVKVKYRAVLSEEFHAIQQEANFCYMLLTGSISHASLKLCRKTSDCGYPS